MNDILIEKLKNGETVQKRCKGNSMTPIFESGCTVEIEPVDVSDIKKDDVVFCKVRGMVCCHLVTAVDETKKRFQISNNHGHVNGWTKTIYGRVSRTVS